MASTVSPTDKSGPQLLDAFWAWFCRARDARVDAHSRTDMHQKRVDHHRRALRRRGPWLFIIGMLTFSVIIAMFSLGLGVEGLVMMAIGITFGALIENALEHLRKVAYHEFVLESPPDE